MNKISLFALLSALFPSLLFANTLQENHLLFALEPTALEQGDVQIALEAEASESFFESWPTFLAMDLFSLQRHQGDKILAARFAFMADRDISTLSKEKIFNAEDFEKISKNITVSQSQMVTPSLLRFSVSKRIGLYKLTSKVDYHFLEENEIRKDERLMKIVEEENESEFPQFATLHRTYDFSGFFNEAMNLCFYRKVVANRTLVTCTTLSSVPFKTFNTIGWLVNIKNTFKEEILFTVNKIKEGK